MASIGVLCMTIRRPRPRQARSAQGRGPRAGQPTRLNRLCGAVIAAAAALAGVVAVAAPAAAGGPPGTSVTKTGKVSLSGSFAGVNSPGGEFQFGTVFPSWVPVSAIDTVSGTITPSPAVNTALATEGASGCILRASSFTVTVDGATPTPQTLDVGYQAGLPMVSALPLSFQLPHLYIGPLTAPGSSVGNMTTWLTGISGTVRCFTSSGAPVATNAKVSYTAGKHGKDAWLAQTSYGTPPPPGTISGTVTDNNSPANVIAGASVYVCTIAFDCTTTTTAANGTYSVPVEPGPYYVVAWPPTSITNLNRGSAGPFTVASNTTSTGNVVLDKTEPLPPGITVPTNTGHAPTSPPTENWHTPFTITAKGCPNGTATWQVQGWNTQTASLQTLTGPMTETPAGSGNYTGTVPPVYPIHGPVHITITIHCPDGTTHTIRFPIYIDPSGTVVNQNGAPISGATVTLYDSSSLGGPWSQVANGDTAIMSPSNTRNPDTTGALGQYGWDVAEGDYQLNATAPGCTPYTTPGFPIPPPVVGLTLTLNCAKPGPGPAWTVSPGGGFTGKASTVKITDTTTGFGIVCRSSVTGTLAAGSALNGPGIGSITGLSFSACTGSGLSLSLTPSALPLALNAASYSGGVSSGTIAGVDATLSGPGCSATVDGTAAQADNGQAGATYNNKQGQLAVLTSGGNLTLYNVQGCLGVIKSGDRAAVSATYKLSPAQTITGP